MSRVAAFLLFFGFSQLLGAVGLAAPVISIEPQYRYTAHLNVAAGKSEGSIEVLLNSEQPAVLVEVPDMGEVLSDSSWRLVFAWNDTLPQILDFTDDSGDTTSLILDPATLLQFEATDLEMPVIDIQTAPENLWSPETGLYVFGHHENCLQHGEEWERPARFVMHDENGNLTVDEAIGLRINGGWSRHLKQKGLRFYFDDYGQQDFVDHDFFDSDPTGFQRLLVRCSLEPRRCFTDMLASDLFADMGHLTSRGASVVILLNGEYWGFAPLRERIDSEFIEFTHDLEGSGYDLMKDGSIVNGDGSSFQAFLAECMEPGDFTSHQWFEHAAATFDLDSYIDWLLLNIYGATTDNGGPSNVAQVRLEDGPWQFISWDEDGLFYWDNFYADFFHFLSINSQEEYDEYLPPTIYTGPAAARIRWAAPFRALLQNSEFKFLFAERYRELMDTLFSHDSLAARFAEIEASQLPEMARHGERWDWGTSYFSSQSRQLYQWFQFRPGILNSQFEDFREYHRAPIELVSFDGVHQNGEGIRLDWTTVSEEGCRGFTVLRGTHPDSLEVVASSSEMPELVSLGGIWTEASYSWTDNDISPGESYFYQLSWEDMHGVMTSLPWTISVATTGANLLINEFLAKNDAGIQDETGAYEDWVEIYNVGPSAAPLGGYFLTDDPLQPMRWELPDVVLPAGDFLLLWCDNDPEDGPLHTNFKLSAAGEFVGLYAPVDEGNILVDGYTFGAQIADVSEGRIQDGGPDWGFFSTPTPGASNEGLSAIGRDALDRHLPMVSSFVLGPNPFNPTTTIQWKMARAEGVNLDIYDVNGRRVTSLLDEEILDAGEHSRTWNGKDSAGRPVASGTYLVRLRAGQENRVGKLMLLK